MPEHSSPRFQVCGGRPLSPPSAAGLVASLLVAIVLPSACTRDEARTTHGATDAAAAPSATAAAAPELPPSLADSAAAADSRFQTARAALNRDAVALDERQSERHTVAYSKAYDDLRRRTLAVESLRADRDALRARLRRRTESSAASDR